MGVAAALQVRRGAWRLAIAGLLAGALSCTPPIYNAIYQSYTVQLNGPVPAFTDPSLDPFVQTARYKVTVSYFEDAAGTVPYGTSLKDKPALFKSFTPTVTVEFAANQTSFPLTPSGGDASLPRLSSSQTSIYVSSEIDGLDASGNPVARGRCPVMQLQILTATLPPQVTCQAFYGLIGRWNQVRAPAQARFDFAAVPLKDGRVVIGGGQLAVDDPTQQLDLDSVEIYDPKEQDPTAPAAPPGTWTTLSQSLSVARSGLTATVTDPPEPKDQTVFFIGGETHGSDGVQLTGAVDELDASTKKMLSSSPLNIPRAQHASALLSGETVYAAAGIFAPMMPSPDIDVLVPTKVPTHGPMLAANRQYPCMVTLPTSTPEILICGGATSTALLSSCEVADAKASHVSGQMAAPRGDVKCALVGQSVYLVGGALPETSATDATRIEVWTSGSIKTVGTAPAGLTQHAAAAAGALVVAVGGYAAGTTTPLATGFIFDTVSKTVTALTGTGAMSNARARFQMVPLPDGTVMAIGGLSNDPLVPVGAEIYVP
jgi:hypothetical protein